MGKVHTSLSLSAFLTAGVGRSRESLQTWIAIEKKQLTDYISTTSRNAGCTPLSIYQTVSCLYCSIQSNCWTYWNSRPILHAARGLYRCKGFHVCSKDYGNPSLIGVRLLCRLDWRVHPGAQIYSIGVRSTILQCCEWMLSRRLNTQPYR